MAWSPSSYQLCLRKFYLVSQRHPSYPLFQVQSDFFALNFDRLFLLLRRLFLLNVLFFNSDFSQLAQPDYFYCPTTFLLFFLPSMVLSNFFFILSFLQLSFPSLIYKKFTCSGAISIFVSMLKIGPFYSLFVCQFSIQSPFLPIVISVCVASDFVSTLLIFYLCAGIVFTLLMFCRKVSWSFSFSSRMTRNLQRSPLSLVSMMGLRALRKSVISSFLPISNSSSLSSSGRHLAASFILATSFLNQLLVWGSISRQSSSICAACKILWENEQQLISKRC